MIRLVVSAVLLATVAACEKNPTDSPIVLHGVTLIEPRDGTHVSDGVIVIDSDRIVAASAAGDVSIPRRATKIDLHGKYAIPGLWDMHTHVQNQRELDVFFPLFVAHGIVGIRDMNGMFPREFSEFGAKYPYRPQVVASGPGIDGPAPDGQEEGAIVDELAAKGVDFIKVFSMVPRSRFLAIMAKAKAHGLVVAGHVPTAVSAMEASDAGMRSLEHHNEMLLNTSSRETELRADRLAKLARLPHFVDRVWEQAFPPIELFLATSREEKALVLFKKFVANRTWQTPTLADWRVWSLAPFDDSGFWSDTADSRAARGGAPTCGASRTDLEEFANDMPWAGRLLRQFSIRLQDHGDRFLEIRARLLQGGALGVGAGQFLGEADVPFGHFAKDGGELKVHDVMIRRGRIRGLTGDGADAEQAAPALLGAGHRHFVRRTRHLASVARLCRNVGIHVD